jgi:hypothetical protein
MIASLKHDLVDDLTLEATASTSDYGQRKFDCAHLFMEGRVEYHNKLELNPILVSQSC